MISIEEMTATAACFVGKPLSQTEQAALQALCESAQTQWQNRLRDELTSDDCRGAFLMACTFTALAGLSAAMQTTQPAAFRAGDVSIQVSDSDVCARSLLTQAELLMAPYTTDEGFAFQEVEG